MSSINFVLNESLLESLQEMITAHSCYLSEYINLLNRYINFIKKVSSLKNERASLIKFVKKLRYLNNYYTFNEKIVVLAEDEQLEDIPLIPIIRRVCSYNIKVLEILDILNFQVTQSIKNEILSKTLNYNIIFDDQFVKIMEDTFRVFIKFNQWMFESLEITGCDMNALDSSLSIDLIDVATKCALDDGIDLEQSSDIILQQVETCSTEEEYLITMNEWIDIIKQNLQKFNTDADTMVAAFHTKQSTHNHGNSNTNSMNYSSVSNNRGSVGPFSPTRSNFLTTPKKNMRRQ